MKLAWVTSVQLSKDPLLLGEDCWADGRYGNYADSRVMLNDSCMIQELREGYEPIVHSCTNTYTFLHRSNKINPYDRRRDA